MGFEFTNLLRGQCAQALPLVCDRNNLVALAALRQFDADHAVGDKPVDGLLRRLTGKSKCAVYVGKPDRLPPQLAKDPHV